MINKFTPHISLIVPAYNESKRLPNTIRQIQQFISMSLLTFEVIVVVEKSMDGTEALAQELCKADPSFKVLINSCHRGKGYAVKTGVLEARGEFIFFMDADLSTSLKEVDRFHHEFIVNSEVSVVIGSRKERFSVITKKPSLIRKVLSVGFNFLVHFVGLEDIRDTQCGFKGFRREVAHQLFKLQTIDGFAFDVEILMLAKKLKHVISALPVQWHDSPKSKLKIWQDSVKMFMDLIRIQYRVGHGRKSRGERVKILFLNKQEE